MNGVGNEESGKTATGTVKTYESSAFFVRNEGDGKRREFCFFGGQSFSPTFFARFNSVGSKGLEDGKGRFEGRQRN